MRTTVVIDDHLVKQIKRMAAEQGQTFREVLTALLKRALTPAASLPRYEFKWVTVKGKLQPGVRLDDRESLWDLMDGRM